ncbi:MAG: hypothetical protein WBR18_05100 [Anaerolineales bacterium]
MKAEISDDAFLKAVQTAINEGLFQLPGLLRVEFGRGFKGEQRAQWCAVWTYRDRPAWERLWGTVDEPVQPADYPPAWRRWERELLGPLLAEPADDIRYTTYEALASADAGRADRSDE